VNDFKVALRDECFYAPVPTNANSGKELDARGLMELALFTLVPRIARTAEGERGQFDTIFRILHGTILLIFEIIEEFCVSPFKFCQIFSFVRHESIVHWTVMLVPNMGGAHLVHSRESNKAAVSARFVDYLHRNIRKFSARVFCHYLNLSFVPKK